MKESESEPKKTGDYSYDDAVELTGHGRYNYILLAGCCIITNAFALDVFGFSTVVAASSCDLKMGLTEIGVLASAPFAGVIFAFPWGFYADSQGRRRALLLSTGVGFLFAALSTIASSWPYLLAVKLIGCSFSSASFTITMTILGECTGVKRRNQFLFIMNSCNLVSEFVVFGIAYFILPLEFNIPISFLGITFRPWRLYALILSLPLLIGFVFIYCLYESPKYLASQGDYVKALDVLKKIYVVNGGNGDDYPVKHIITTEDTKLTTSFFKTLAHHTVPIFKPPLLWRTIQLFFLMALCCSTNNVFAMWFPTIMNIYFLSFSDEAAAEAVGGQSFCERIVQDTGISDSNTYTCNEHISLNTIYTGMAYGLFFFSTNLMVTKLASRPRLVTISILLISGVSANLVDLRNPIANIIFFTLVQCTALGICSVASYFVDLYPTCHRGLVTSLGMMTARLASLVGVNLMGVLITKHCSLTFSVWSVVIFFGVIVSLFLPPDRPNKDNCCWTAWFDLRRILKRKSDICT